MVQQFVWSSWYEGVRIMRRAGLPLLLTLWFLASTVGFWFFDGGTVSILTAEMIENPLIAQNETIRYLNNSLGVSFVVLNIGALFGGLAIPIMNAELFALDNQAGVLRWYDALPVSGWQYVLAKITAVSTIMLMTVLLISVSSGLLYWVVYGAFDVWFYSQTWLFLLVPIIFCVGAIVTLLTIICQTRRQALLLGVAIGCVTYIYLAPRFFQYQLTEMFLFMDAHKNTIHQILCEAGMQCEPPQFYSLERTVNWPLAVLQMLGVVFLAFLLAGAWHEWRQSARS